MNDPFDHAEQLAGWFGETDLAVLELSGPRGTLRLLRDGAGRPQIVRDDVPRPSDTASVVVRAPGVGVFLTQHPLHLEEASCVGAEVRAGEPLGFLRVGPLLTAVSAPRDAIVAAIHARAGTAVGYGTALFTLDLIGDEAAP